MRMTARAASPVINLTPRFPRVAMLSLWRNDAERDIQARMDRLTDKSYRHPNLRWIWVCGDSDDATASILGDYAAQHTDKYITIVEHQTGHVGNDHLTRLKRLSLSVSEGLSMIIPMDDYVIIHESDLVSPRDLVEQFIATKKPCIAATTWLQLDRGLLFYDIWAFRANGKRFTNEAPYHEVYREDELFKVDCVGSCWMFPAQYVRDGLRCEAGATREICAKLNEAFGQQFWVAAWIKVQQPRELWEPFGMSDTEMNKDYWR